MQLFPAIDLRGGQVVRLTQGDYDRMTVYGQDPCAQARSFVAAGAKNLHVVDLDGAKDGTLSNYDTIAALAKQGGLYIEVGGGIRTEERIEKYLSLGVGRCILGSVAVTDFAFTARMLQKYGDKIAVGVDAKDGYVAIHGWKEVSAEPGVAFCKRLAEAGCTAIIYTDIACDGAMQGTNLALYRQLAAEVPGWPLPPAAASPPKQSCWNCSRWARQRPFWAKACTPARWTLPAACSWCRTEKEGAL